MGFKKLNEVALVDMLKTLLGVDENGNVVQMPSEMFKSNDDGNVKDWDVNDSNNPQYIHNRPIYIDVALGDIDWVIENLKSRYINVVDKSDVYYNTNSANKFFEFGPIEPSSGMWSEDVLRSNGVTLLEINAGKKFKFLMSSMTHESYGYIQPILVPVDEIGKGFPFSILVTYGDADGIGIVVSDEIWKQFTIDPIVTFKHAPNESSVKIGVVVDKRYEHLFDKPPYVVDSENYRYGDECLQAILDGKTIYVKVPNKENNKNYVNFMPVIQSQLPDNGNDYLTLFYLKDGIATNLVTALQKMMQGDVSGLNDVFGEITMQLTKPYNECPLKVNAPFN